MGTLLATFIATVAVMAFFVAALGIKMIFKKDGEFKGGCASNNPMLVNEIGECGVCGKKPGEECASEDKLPEIG
ncbi:MAG: hypothetical protein ACPG4Z_06055 [Chitinophagales bacterium]